MHIFTSLDVTACFEEKNKWIFCFLLIKLHLFFLSYCGVFHGGTRIDFNKPCVVFAVNHKIIAKHFEWILSLLYAIFATFYWIYDYLLHLFLNLTVEHILPVFLCLFLIKIYSLVWKFSPLIFTLTYSANSSICIMVSLTFSSKFSACLEMQLFARWANLFYKSVGLYSSKHTRM